MGCRTTPRLGFKNLKGGRVGVSYGDGRATHMVKGLALYAGMIPKRGVVVPEIPITQKPAVIRVLQNLPFV